MRRWFTRFVPYFLFFLASILYSYPLLRHPTTAMVDTYDGMLTTWLMNWSAYSLTHAPLEFFHAPIFYPYRWATTFSDPMVSSGLLVAPILAVTHEPILTNTINTFLSFFLTAAFGYALLTSLTGRKLVSFAQALLELIFITKVFVHFL
jgi:hypothetical protein